MFTVYCSLLTAHYPLLTTHCSLPLTRYLPITILTTHYLQLRCGAERPTVEFKRATLEEGAKLRSELVRGAGKSHHGGLGGALTADCAKVAAAAEMRNRARAVGVNRAELSSSSMIQLGRTV